MTPNKEFKTILDAFFPRWLDLALHTNVSIFILLEMIFAHHRYPQRKTAVRGLTLFMLGYLIWLYYIYINTGKWVYGIIGVFSAPQRIIFFVSSGLVTLALYLIGELMNKLLSGSKTDVKVKSK